MEVVTYSSFRQNLKTLVDRMIDRCEPLYVKRSRGEDFVVMSKSEFNSLQETLYLLSSPKNAERLLSSINSANTKEMTAEELEQWVTSGE